MGNLIPATLIRCANYRFFQNLAFSFCQREKPRVTLGVTPK